ncbi:divalent cation transporter [Haloprofundus marisrubri]|uniref:Divalent cation transporter n=1 Tax=Haloprofundus marisrubri TaxID=1514971 RepID=A0A0W1RAH6_9EURY|nr:divalent-cation tolerance protein CutA [Haloprofundus marisrubri]KTG10460.1 divalent cation transporter [Haloprofundus marisrubri]
MPTAYITVPESDASTLARTLVDERLAACVNQFPCASTYRWEGDVVEEEEVVLLAKTTDEAYDELRDRVLELHPHETPCIERFDESDVLDSFAAWRAGAVGSDEA